MNRIEEIKERWKPESNPDIAVINAPNDVRYLLSLNERMKSELAKARDKAQILASHCAHALDSGRAVDVSYAFGKSQEVYEILRDALEE